MLPMAPASLEHINIIAATGRTLIMKSDTFLKNLKVFENLKVILVAF